MTDLVKQLEDKKKGCGRKFNLNPFGYVCGTLLKQWTPDNTGKEEVDLCSICKSEIAILEQAIAEIKNIQSQQNKTTMDNRFSQSGVDYPASAEGLDSRTNSADTPQEKISEVQFKALFPDIEKSPVVSNLLQKQRQEILEQIGYKLFSEDEQKSNNVWYKKGWDDSAKRINKVIQEVKELNCLPMNYIEINEKIDKLVEKQLNQPKTEDKGLHKRTLLF